MRAGSTTEQSVAVPVEKSPQPASPMVVEEGSPQPVTSMEPEQKSPPSVATVEPEEKSPQLETSMEPEKESTPPVTPVDPEEEDDDELVILQEIPRTSADEPDKDSSSSSATVSGNSEPVVAANPTSEDDFDVEGAIRRLNWCPVGGARPVECLRVRSAEGSLQIFVHGFSDVVYFDMIDVNQPESEPGIPYVIIYDY